MRQVICLALRQDQLLAGGFSAAGGPAADPGARQITDRSQRQLPVACDYGSENAAFARLVKDRLARTRAPHPYRLRDKRGPAPATAAKWRVHRRALNDRKASPHFRRERNRAG